MTQKPEIEEEVEVDLPNTNQMWWEFVIHINKHGHHKWLPIIETGACVGAVRHYPEIEERTKKLLIGGIEEINEYYKKRIEDSNLHPIWSED